jgi:hypothetical protein
MPFTWDTMKGTRFFICFQQTRKARRKMFLYIVEYRVSIGSLRMNNLKRSCRST